MERVIGLIVIDVYDFLCSAYIFTEYKVLHVRLGGGGKSLARHIAHRASPICIPYIYYFSSSTCGKLVVALANLFY